MKTLELILQILSLMPAIPAPAPAAQPVAGTATLVVADCQPGETVEIEPGNFRAFVPEDGTVKLKVPAQAAAADPYLIKEARGSHAFNGAAAAGQMLTGVCL